MRDLIEWQLNLWYDIRCAYHLSNVTWYEWTFFEAFRYVRGWGAQERGISTPKEMVAEDLSYWDGD